MHIDEIAKIILFLSSISTRVYQCFTNDSYLQLVDQVSTRYDQQLKLAQNCRKFEREEDDLIEARIGSSIGKVVLMLMI